jgi:hypothetical protein
MGDKEKRDAQHLQRIYRRGTKEVKIARDLRVVLITAIDCQNLFCEVDKFALIAHPKFSLAGERPAIKQTFKPSGPLAKPFSLLSGI